MSVPLTPEEVATIIRSRRLLKEKGLSPDTNVKTLCSKVGISRKTGYQWEKRLDQTSRDDSMQEELSRLKAEHEKLKKAYDDVSWENEGRKLAWEIHEVDAMIAQKKALWPSPKRKSGSVFTIVRAAGTSGGLGVGGSAEYPVVLEPWLRREFEAADHAGESGQVRQGHR
jgi:hypothetical protein